MNNKKLPELGKATRFSSTNQPKNSGRKKNMFNYLKGDYDLSQSDLDNIINYISMMTVEEFNDLALKVKTNDDSISKMPIIIVRVFQAYQKANVDDIVKLMRAAGKANDRKEIVGKDNSDLFEAFKENLNS